MSASGWHRKQPTANDAARRKEYDSPEYRAVRKQIRALIDSGQAHCWRCGKHVPPGAGHTGHSDDHARVMGAECTKCNLRAAASKGARITNAARKAVVFVRPVR